MKVVIPRMKKELVTHPNATATTPVVRVVDWEAMEPDWRAGIKSKKELAKEYGVSRPAIDKHWAKAGVERDLTARIQANADALVARDAVAYPVARATKVIEKDVVEANGMLVASVRIGHRKTISRGHVLCQSLLQELEDQTFDTVILGQLGELMRSPDDSGMDKLNDLYKKIISTPGRVDTAKKLIETMKSVIAMEREAYSIDAIAPDANTNPMVTLLTEMRRSYLPIAHEVPRDDSL